MAPGRRLILWVLVLVGTLAATVRPLGPLPALGPLLDPSRGVWGTANTAELPRSARAVIPGLADEVRVLYDDRRVPHVFASAVSDAYRALGYVVARDRLFQLELQTRATAGTLTELLGDGLLDADIRSRRLGLARAAERSWRELSEQPDVRESLRAYAEGVNAFIDGLSPGERPFEYHLLGAYPAAWKPAHTLYLMKRMGWILAYDPTELTKSRVAALAGRDAADALFPVHGPVQEPVFPFSGPRYTEFNVPGPGQPDTASQRLLTVLQAASLRAGQLGLPGRPASRMPVLGSNNWAVAASRSASGNALLAGDPHLNLSLPSIWYEAHLVVPGKLDVYGVTLAGVPGIVIGFNRDVAWSFTNNGADVMDYYREETDDRSAPRAYRLDGEWKPLEMRVEEFRDPRGRVLATDTVLHTHRGPLFASGGLSLSLRWTVLDSENELRALAAVARARTVHEWLEAMSGWYAPIQNGLVADGEGRIAIQSAGFYPRRPEGTRGDEIYDGTTRGADWLGSRSVPLAVDPGQGYLASANQEPVDPLQDSVYLGADWPPPWRALTINELLRDKELYSAADLEAFQSHATGVRSRVFRTVFLEAASRLEGRAGPDPDVNEAARLLADWNGDYSPDQAGPVLFEAAMDALEALLWDELEDSAGIRVASPGTQITWALLSQPGSAWWDNGATAPREDRDALLGRALAGGLERAKATLGPVGADGWRWGDAAQFNIYHLLRIPALSRLGLSSVAGPGLLSPLSGDGTHGASWRMVVELGDTVMARGTYPGGQSGNPFSAAYDDRLDLWKRGELADLRYPRNEDQLRNNGWAGAELLLTGTPR